MNSKILFAFILAVNICVINVTAQVYTYGVFVRTSDDFDSHEGKLMLSVISNYSNIITQEDFVLTPNDIEIKKDKTYESTISSIVSLDKITSVYLRWTLAAPDNPYYAIKEPTIYFNSIILSLFTLKPDPEFSQCTSYYFYPAIKPIGIKHMDRATFYPRDTETVWKYYKEYSNITVLDAACPE